jgi:hypothetical protein
MRDRGGLFDVLDDAEEVGDCTMTAAVFLSSFASRSARSTLPAPAS